jgi:hypothetical protein
VAEPYSDEWIREQQELMRGMGPSARAVATKTFAAPGFMAELPAAYRFRLQDALEEVQLGEFEGALAMARTELLFERLRAKQPLGRRRKGGAPGRPQAFEP